MLNKKVSELVKRKFRDLTTIQKIAIPKVLEGKDLLIVSDTGTGKTEAALLPVLSRILNEKPKEISTLYITPLKALNRDLLSRILWWTEKLGIEVSVRHGDTSPYIRKQQTEFPPQILILTVETLQPILVGAKIRNLLKNVKWVILDEVHELVGSKRGVQLSLGLERLRKIANFQTLMLSATVFDEEETGKFFSHNFNVIKVLSEKKKEVKVVCPEKKKEDIEISQKQMIPLTSASRVRLVKELIEKSTSSLVFTNTREFAEALVHRIKMLMPGFRVEVHHSSLGKDVRIEVEKKFKNQKIKAIVCTSSLQLGIDIGSVDLVIQYGSPRKVVQFLQRLGRSGHALEKISKGFIIPTDLDEILESAVIAKMALENKLDFDKTYVGGLDVLAHQIAGMVLEGYDDIEEIYETLKKSYPLRMLDKKTFLKVCQFLENTKIVKIKNNKLSKGSKIFEFYFSRLSTIPSETQYKLVDVTSNKTIAILDEEFVVSEISVGSKILVKGNIWKVINIEEDKVYAELCNEKEGAIPSWRGELIPVSYEVAQDVGKLLGILWDMKESERLEFLKNNYPLAHGCLKFVCKTIKKQKNKWDNKTIWIEKGKKVLVLSAPFGNKVNSTLSKFIQALLTSRLGEKIDVYEDSYRIFIFSSVNPYLIKEILEKTDPNHLELYLNLFLPSTKLFVWKFVQVAKRFGLINERINPSDFLIKKLIEEFSGTPVFQETLNEIKNEKLDVERTADVLRKIKNKEIEVKISDQLSYFSQVGLEKRFKEFFLSEKEESELLRIVEKRLKERKFLAICMNCGKWWRILKVEDINKNLKCSVCGSRLIAFSKKLSPRIVKIVQKGLRRSKLSREEKRIFESLKERAYLFLDNGKLFAFVFAGRGIGLKAAKRILQKKFLDKKEILKAIVDEERKYVLTKKFWKL